MRLPEHIRRLLKENERKLRANDEHERQASVDWEALWAQQEAEREFRAAARLRAQQEKIRQFEAEREAQRIADEKRARGKAQALPGTLVTFLDIDNEREYTVYLASGDKDGSKPERKYIEKVPPLPAGMEYTRTDAPLGSALTGAFVDDELEVYAPVEPFRCRVISVIEYTQAVVTEQDARSSSISQTSAPVYAGRGRDAKTETDGPDGQELVRDFDSQDGSRYLGWMAHDSDGTFG